jgi:prenylcysteine oxidase/farnesylcysteine lyase
MRLHTRLTLTAAAACHFLTTHAIDVDADNAAQWPISSPGNVDTHASALFPATTSATRRVAVIGAGAGGSSAAFWIGKAKERYGLDVEVDVYERSDYVGGRECLLEMMQDWR